LSQSTSTSSLHSYSVLPDNKSALERAIELALAEQLYQHASPFPGLLNAETTTNKLLPFLAHDAQVPIWDDDAPDELKRRLARDAWIVRRLAGTKKGIKTALESLGFKGEITPWYEQSAEPYSLEIITAWEHGNNPVNVANAKKLLSYIDEAKSERDTVTLSLAYGVEQNMGLAGAIAPAVNFKSSSHEARLWELETKTELALCGAAQVGTSINNLEIQAELSITNTSAALYLAAGAYVYSIGSVEATAIL
jgi:phage tail protein, P2 protein I family